MTLEVFDLLWRSSALPWCSSVPLRALAPTSELFACFSATTEIPHELSVCPVMAKETVCEFCDCPVMAMEAVGELSVCPGSEIEGCCICGYLMAVILFTMLLIISYQ